jgi:hypothetical protein
MIVTGLLANVGESGISTRNLASASWTVSSSEVGGVA